MSTLDSLASELTGNVPRLPKTLALKHINRAYSQIREKRLWSFLIGESGVFFPSILPTSGAPTVSVTYGSPTVVGDAAAVADWSTQLLAVVPLVQRQFRVGSGGPIYNITAISQTNIANDTLTLDLPYSEETNAATTFSIYRCYVPAPVRDFKRWQTVFDPVNGYALIANVPRVYVDIVDPTRGSQGQAYRVVNYKTAADGTPMFEWWPQPTSQITYHTLWERRGVDLGLTDSPPPQIPEEVLIDWALAYYSYPWANAQVGRFPELKGTNWLALAIESKNRIHGRRGEPGRLATMMRADEETFQQTLTLLRKSWAMSWPPSGAFEQSHSLWNLGAGS